MSKAEEIADGFKNLAKDKLGMLSEEDKKRNDERMALCQACEHKTDLGRCRKCGCVLSAKTKCDSCTCPIGKW